LATRQNDSATAGGKTMGVTRTHDQHKAERIAATLVKPVDIGGIDTLVSCGKETRGAGPSRQ